METEITVMALAGVLLLAHIQIAVHYKTKQYGVEWNTGPRDEDMPPLKDVPARLARARDNFTETLPLAIIALFGVVIADKTSDLTSIAAWIWLTARVVYLPLYWIGVKVWRTVVWAASTIALLVVLGTLLFA